MRRNEWIEHGQRFFHVGSQICTAKPARIKLAYGDRRLEELRARRRAADIEPTRGLSRLISRIFASRQAA